LHKAIGKGPHLRHYAPDDPALLDGFTGELPVPVVAIP
jgi:hypothetical protein